MAAGLDRLRAWMESAGAGAAYVTDPVSIGYLAGWTTDPHERLLALVVRPDAAVLVVPGLEAESARAGAAGIDVRGWRDGEDPWALVAAALGGAPALALERDHVTLAAADRVLALAGSDRVLDAGPAIRGMRLLKTATELGLLARAAAITDRVIAEAAAGMRPGQTELELAGRVLDLVARAGAEPSFRPLVQFGPDSAMPHLAPGPRALAAGEPVLLDLGAAWQGYRADITRMAVLGTPDPRLVEVHAVVLAANRAGVAAIRAGVTAGEVDETARAVIRDAGYGDAFIHRLGHGLGLEAHEGPSLDPGSSMVLEAGMVVTVEPGVYLPGWGGVRIEDDVVVEATRGWVLTAAPHELLRVSAG